MFVWKFVLFDVQRPLDVVEVLMPAGARVLSVQAQSDQLVCLWVEADPDAPRETWKFALCGTGDKVPEQATYFGTAQTGLYVWHVYKLEHDRR